jgi:hypothetical protein
MKRLALVVVGFLALSIARVSADEGMWLLPMLKQMNIDVMRAKGCKLTAEEIYSINQSSLKDAIVHFGGGCTAEIVSAEGLLFTNHHCGYDAIQQHSTVEHDYLKDGFWAKTKAEELPNPGLTATFLVRMEDVSDRVSAVLPSNLSESDRHSRIDSISKIITEETTKGTPYTAEVESFFGGNDFYLLVYETFKDVRFVGAPPSSIGKFGADTDNWMWPRHTGDFSIFRVYTAPDGSPAEYSLNNVPLKPRHHLNVSIDGIKEGDFTMVMGYPGTTNRYMSACRTASELNITHPNRVKIRGLRQDIWMKDMQADPAIKIKYASKYARSSNYWKFSIGQMKGLKRLNVIERKQALEDSFKIWVAADVKRTAKYGTALDIIRDADKRIAPLQYTLQYLSEGIYRSIDIVAIARKSYELLSVLKDATSSPEKIKAASDKLRSTAREMYKDYNMSTDKKEAEAMFRLVNEDVYKDFLPGFYQDIQKKYKNDFAKYTNDLYEKSVFADSTRLFAFLEKPSVKKLEKDPALIVTVSTDQVYSQLYDAAEKYFNDIDKGNRLFIAGLREMNPSLVKYPDANSTMRLTYGTVGGYSPADAVNYKYYTTLKGVMEKEDSTNWEFVVPAKLKALYKAKDYGQYGSNGELVTCFTTNNDITGGNSGSPVLNAKGDLIGLAFDGNWEAMSGDKVFENELQKCICVDVRYVLFIIDKYAGATNLIKELQLVKD